MTTNTEMATAHRELTPAEVKALRLTFAKMPRYTRDEQDIARLQFLAMFTRLYNDGVRARSIGQALGRPYQPKWWKKAAREAGFELRKERLCES